MPEPNLDGIIDRDVADTRTADSALGASLAKRGVKAFLTFVVHEAGQIAGADAGLIGMAVAAATGNPILGASAAALAMAAGEATKGDGIAVPVKTISDLVSRSSIAAEEAIVNKTGSSALGAQVSASISNAAAAALKAVGS